MIKFKNLLPYLAITSILLTACGNKPESEEKPKDIVEETEEIVDIEDDKNEDQVRQNPIDQPLHVTTNIVAIYTNYYEKGDMSKPSPMDHESDIGNFEIDIDYDTDTYINYNSDDAFLSDIRQNPERYFDGLDEMYVDVYNAANTLIDKDPIDVALNNKTQTLYEFKPSFGDEADDSINLLEAQYYINAHSNFIGMNVFYPEHSSSKIVVINKQLDKELSDYYNAPSQVDYLKDSDQMLKDLMQDSETTTTIDGDVLSHFVRQIYEDESYIIGIVPSEESVLSQNENSDKILHVDIFNEFVDVFTSDEVISAIETHLK